MPDLLLPNVPQEVLDQLQASAAKHEHSLAEEAIRVLKERLPDEPFLTEEISAPCTLPFPGTKETVSGVREAGLRLPDPPWIMAEPR